MQDLRITLVQADQRWEDKQANFDRYKTLLNTVETDLIVLPEMFHTGFTMNTVLAEPMDGLGVTWLKEMAKTKNAAIYTSLIIQESGGVYNRGVFVEPSGAMHGYDKRKTFGLAGEDKHYRAGNQETIVNYLGWNFQLQICYDLRFPEVARNRMEGEKPAYDVLLYVANWPEKRAAHWNALLPARAIENQCFVVGVNRVGQDASGHSYSGDTQLIDALGEVERTERYKAYVASYLLNMNKLDEVRGKIPFLKDR